MFTIVCSGDQQQRRAALEFQELLARQSTDDSGAFSLSTAKDIAEIGSDVASAVHNVVEYVFRANHSRIPDANACIGSSFKQQRDFDDLLARATEDESGAFSLSAAKDIASIGSDVASAVHSIVSYAVPMIDSALPSTNVLVCSSFQQRRDLQELLARADDDSSALSLSAVKDIASIGSDVASAVNNIVSYVFTIKCALANINMSVYSSFKQQRDFEELLARAEDDSGAFSLSAVKDIASIGSDVASAVNNIVSYVASVIYSGLPSTNLLICSSFKQQRDFEELLARAEDDSGAISLSAVKDIASIGSDVASAVNNIVSYVALMTHDAPPSTNRLVCSSFKQQRDFEELLARDLWADEIVARSLEELD